MDVDQKMSPLSALTKQAIEFEWTHIIAISSHFDWFAENLTSHLDHMTKHPMGFCFFVPGEKKQKGTQLLSTEDL